MDWRSDCRFAIVFSIYEASLNTPKTVRHGRNFRITAVNSGEVGESNAKAAGARGVFYVCTVSLPGDYDSDGTQSIIPPKAYLKTLECRCVKKINLKLI